MRALPALQKWPLQPLHLGGVPRPHGRRRHGRIHGGAPQSAPCASRQHPPRGGALVEPMSVAYHAAILGDVRDQSQALIYGAGPIGIGLWFALRGMGLTEIDVIEPSETRRKSIEALGARTLDPTAVDVPALIADR